jgi:hypothetical protein
VCAEILDNILSIRCQVCCVMILSITDDKLELLSDTRAGSVIRIPGGSSVFTY